MPAPRSPCSHHSVTGVSDGGLLVFWQEFEPGQHQAQQYQEVCSAGSHGNNLPALTDCANQQQDVVQVVEN